MCIRIPRSLRRLRVNMRMSVEIILGFMHTCVRVHVCSCEWSSLDLQNMRMASPLMIIDGKENRATLPIRANANTKTAQLWRMFNISVEVGAGGN